MGMVARCARAALLAGLMASTPACYDPELRDCSVTCAAASDCAGGQVCGSDGYCSAPSVAGSCARDDVGGGGGEFLDAGPMVDASGPVLRITISGGGKVEVSMPTFTCNSRDTGDCTVSVTAGATLRLTAKSSGDRRFDGWTTSNCASQDATCHLTATPTTTVVGARFIREDDDD